MDTIKEKGKRLFTSESVSEGHPDKICDRISDAILDAYLAQDAYAKVACETIATTNTIIVAGEINAKAEVNVEQIVRDTLDEIGYTHCDVGIDAQSCQIQNLLDEQSLDIAMGVDERNDGQIGAGDQGMMFGYAEKGNEHYMPLPIIIAHELVRRATLLRKQGIFKGARPDMKSQVTIDYSNEVPLIDTIVMSVQHDDDYNEADFKQFLKGQVIDAVLQEFNVYQRDYKLFINPTGRFVIGGPKGDTGLTGRKIIVDTYGGYARHGGGAFSGKDATKVDRSGAYMARYLAKNIVASGLADQCEIQIAYAIGEVQPVSLFFETFGTGKVSHDVLRHTILSHIDLSPQGIIDHLQLRRPIYEQTATYGHFGRIDLDLPWEKLDLVPLLQHIRSSSK